MGRQGRGAQRALEAAPRCLLRLPTTSPRCQGNRHRYLRADIQPGRGGRRNGRRHQQSGLMGPIFGHVGDGNFHAILLIDTDDGDEVGRAKAVSGRMIARSLEAGGTMSGEPGRLRQAGFHGGRTRARVAGDERDQARARPKEHTEPGKSGAAELSARLRCADYD